jgi:hypothetical protein
LRSREMKNAARGAAFPFGMVVASKWISTAHQADHGRDREQDDRDEKDELRDFDGGAGDAAEAEQSRDQGDDEKSDSPTKHGVTSHTD